MCHLQSSSVMFPRAALIPPYSTRASRADQHCVLLSIGGKEGVAPEQQQCAIGWGRAW